MSIIGTVDVLVTANTKQFDSGLDKGKQSAKKFGQDLSKFNVLDMFSPDKVSGAITGLIAKAGAVALAFLGVKHIWGEVTKQFDEIATLGKLASRLGIATDHIAGFQLAFRKAGYDTDQMSQLFVKFQKNVGDASAGVGEARTAFAMLGLDMKALKAQTPEEQFLSVINTLARIPSQADRIALAMRIFGESGAGIALTFKDGAKSIDEMLAKAQSLGLSFNKDTAAAAIALAKARKELDLAMQGMWRTGAIWLANTINSLRQYAKPDSFVGKLFAGGQGAADEEAAKQQLELSKPLLDLIDKYKDEAKAIGLTNTQAELRKALLQSGTTSTEQYATSIAKLVERIRALAGQQGLAQQAVLLSRVVEGLKQIQSVQDEVKNSDPYLQLLQTIIKYNAALQTNNITQKAYDQHMADAYDKFAGVTDPVRELTEGIERLNRARSFIGEDRYAAGMAKLKETFLGFGDPVQTFERRIVSLSKALGAGAISSMELARASILAKQEILKVELSPADQTNLIAMRQMELDLMKRKGDLTEEQYRRESKRNVTDYQKQLEEANKTPLERMKEEVANLNMWKAFLPPDLVQKELVRIAKEAQGEWRAPQATEWSSRVIERGWLAQQQENNPQLRIANLQLETGKTTVTVLEKIWKQGEEIQVLEIP